MIRFTATLTVLALLASASMEAQTVIITRGGSRADPAGAGDELHG